jgi:hypothetical protein
MLAGVVAELPSTAKRVVEVHTFGKAWESPRPKSASTGPRGRAPTGRLHTGEDEQASACLQRGERLHAMPSTPFHEALCRLALHHVSPAQGPWEIRRRGVTRGGARDWC